MCSTDLITFLRAEMERQQQISRLLKKIPKNLEWVSNIIPSQVIFLFILHVVLSLTISPKTSKLFLMDPVFIQ